MKTLKDVFYDITGCEYIDTPAGKLKDVDVLKPNQGPYA